MSGTGAEREPERLNAVTARLEPRFNELHLVEGEAVVAAAPTYRGEGKACQ